MPSKPINGRTTGNSLISSPVAEKRPPTDARRELVAANCRGLARDDVLDLHAIRAACARANACAINQRTRDGLPRLVSEDLDDADDRVESSRIVRLPFLTDSHCVPDHL